MIETIDGLASALLHSGHRVKVPTWHALDVEYGPQGDTWELCHQTFSCFITDGTNDMKPNLPWAENQFKERVLGEPLNPGETYKEWPWYREDWEHQEHTLFSHTYMERYWPMKAGKPDRPLASNKGIRYEYGDLLDVVALLSTQPTTRQAYLPIFFPEDTGARHKQRVPCTLGYLFLIRDGRLSIEYHIRSCDFFRHFRDDVYMTCRLAEWVAERLMEGGNREVALGRLYMHIGSLHVFYSELPRLGREHGHAWRRNGADRSK